MNYNGCFRCHTESHVSDEGSSISRDCNVCHLINAQGPKENLQVAVYNQFLEFNHPDGDDLWKEALCTDCHTGLNT